MGTLFIANVSMQHQMVTYRMDIDNEGNFSERMRQNALRFENIPSGKQVPVSGSLHANQIKTIIDQLSVYGMISATDVPNNLRGVAHLVFSIDKPISENVLRAVHAHNTGAKIEEGALRRERAAVAANEKLAEVVGTNTRAFDVEFEQEEVSDNDESRIEQGFHVVKDAKPSKKSAAAL